MPRWSAGTVGASFELDISDGITQLHRIQQAISQTVNTINNQINSVQIGRSSISGLQAIANAARPLGNLFTQITRQSLETYSRLEQSIQGVNTILRGQAEDTINYAANAFSSAGLSMSQYLENSMGMMNLLLQDSRNTIDDVTELTNTAMQNAGDISALYGIPAETVLGVIQSISRGIYLTFDNLRLGYAGTKSGVENMIRDAGLANEMFDRMGNLNFGTFLRALNLTVERLNIAGTAAREAEQTIQGALREITAGFYNLLGLLPAESTEVGRETIQNIINGINEGIRNLANRIRVAFENIWDNLPFSNLTRNLIVSLAVINPALRLADTTVKSIEQTARALMTPVATVIGGAITGIRAINDRVIDLRRTYLTEFIGNLTEATQQQQAVIEELVQRQTAAQEAYTQAAEAAAQARVTAEQRVQAAATAAHNLRMRQLAAEDARKAAIAAADEARELRRQADILGTAAANEAYIQARQRASAAATRAQEAENSALRYARYARMQNTAAANATRAATEAGAEAEARAAELARIKAEYNEQNANYVALTTRLQQEQNNLERLETTAQRLQTIRSGADAIASGTTAIFRGLGRVAGAVTRISFGIMVSQMGSVLRNSEEVRGALAAIPQVLGRIVNSTEVFGDDLGEMRQTIEDAFQNVAIDDFLRIIRGVEVTFENIMHLVQDIGRQITQGFSIQGIFDSVGDIGHTAAGILGTVAGLFTSVLRLFGVNVDRLRTQISEIWTSFTLFIRNSVNTVQGWIGAIGEFFGIDYIDDNSTAMEIENKAEEEALDERRENFREATRDITDDFNTLQTAYQNALMGRSMHVDTASMLEDVNTQLEVAKRALDLDPQNQSIQRAVNSLNQMHQALEQIQENNDVLSTRPGGGASYLQSIFGSGRDTATAYINSIQNLQNEPAAREAITQLAEADVSQYVEQIQAQANSRTNLRQFTNLWEALDEGSGDYTRNTFLLSGENGAQAYLDGYIEELNSRTALTDAERAFRDFWQNATEEQQQAFIEENRSSFVEAFMIDPEQVPVNEEEWEQWGFGTGEAAGTGYGEGFADAVEESVAQITNTLPELPEWDTQYISNDAATALRLFGGLRDIPLDDFQYGLTHGWESIVNMVTTSEDAIQRLNSGLYELDEGFTRVGDNIYHDETLTADTARSALETIAQEVETGNILFSSNLQSAFASLYPELEAGADEASLTIQDKADAVLQYLLGETGDLTEEQIQQIESALNELTGKEYQVQVNVNAESEDGGVGIHSDQYEDELEGMTEDEQESFDHLKGITDNAQSVLDSLQTVGNAIIDALMDSTKRAMSDLEDAIEEEKKLLEDESDYISNWYDERTIAIQNAVEQGTITQETAAGMQANLDQENLRRTQENTEARENIEETFQDENGKTMADYYTDLDKLQQAKYESDKAFATAELLIKGIVTLAESIFTSDPFKAVSAIASIIGGLITQFGTSYKGSTYSYAQGGVFNRPTLGVFGEAGAEAIVPLERNTKWINRVADAMIQRNPAAAFAAGLGNTNNNNNITNNFTYNSPKAIDAVTANRLLKRTSRRLVTGVY